MFVKLESLGGTVLVNVNHIVCIYESNLRAIVLLDEPETQMPHTDKMHKIETLHTLDEIVGPLTAVHV